MCSSAGVLAANNNQKPQYVIPLTAPSVLGLTLLKSTFADAERKLGASKQYTESSDMEAPVAVCYRSNNSKDNIALVLDSDYTGGWNRISGYALEYGRPTKKTSCGKSSLITPDMKVLDGHVRLGMTKQEVTAILGKPRNRNYGHWKDLPKNTDPDSWDYMTTWKIPFAKAKAQKMKKAYGGDWSDKDAYYDAWIDVTLNFKHSKLVEVSVNHGVTD